MPLIIKGKFFMVKPTRIFNNLLFTAFYRFLLYFEYLINKLKNYYYIKHKAKFKYEYKKN